MNIYHHDVFYRLKDNTIENKIRLLEWSKKYCYNWWVDDLPNIQRRKIDMPWDEIITKLNISSHFVIIHRRGYENWKNSKLDVGWKIEIGFRTMEVNDLFLFIYLKEKFLDEMIKKFELKPLLSKK